MDEFWNVVRRIALEVMGSTQIKGTLVCTAYNPKTHAVKGIIQPHGVESGWVPIAALHVGNGFGVLVGPKVGDPQKLDGDQFDLQADMGDPNTLVAHHRQFSTPDAPPEVQSGEMLLMHEKGTKAFFRGRHVPDAPTWANQLDDHDRQGRQPHARHQGQEDHDHDRRAAISISMPDRVL